MKLAVASVLTRGSWIAEARDIDERLTLMREIIELAGDGALVVLPAGYFVCPSTRARNRTADRVLQHLRGAACAVAWGIDVRPITDARTSKSGKGAARDDYDYDPRLTWYGYLRDARGSLLIAPTQQVAYRSSQFVRHDRLPRDRIHEIAGTRVGVLVCGEILARVYGRGRSVNRVRDVLKGADVIVDAAHANIPIRGFTRWTTAIAATGRQAGTRVTVVAQHLDVDNLHGRKFATRGEAPRLASRAGDKCWCRREPIVCRRGAGTAALVDIYDV